MQAENASPTRKAELLKCGDDMSSLRHPQPQLRPKLHFACHAHAFEDCKLGTCPDNDASVGSGSDHRLMSAPPAPNLHRR